MHKLSVILAATCLQFVLAVHRLAPSSAEKLVKAGVSSLADSRRLDDQSSEISNNTRQVRSVCLWDCSSARQKVGQQQEQQNHQKQKQNTTRLLLFTRAGGGEETGELGAASFTKFSPANELRESKFEAQHHTILMIHGFRGSGISRQPWALETKELALAIGRPGANVLFADWSHHARVLSYLHSVEHLTEVAEDLFSMFESFQSVFPGFRMESMEIIGHSLGAHIAGLLGQMMRGRLSKITALDPTGFLLNSARSHLKLSYYDAKYVIAYHTDTRYFGTNMNLAHRDVYFGDGSNQPACGRDYFAAQFLPSTCNHRLSTRYSSTYMGLCLMVGYLCGSYAEFASGACGFCDRDSPDCVLVGHKWQYYSQLADRQVSPESTGLHKANQRSPQDSRYFIEVQADKPYCAFAYQVVALLPDIGKLSQLKHLELLLVANSNSTLSDFQEVLRVRLTNQRHLNRAKVFQDSRGQVGLVEGELVFTGLALLRSSSKNSTGSPLKFNEALIGEAGHMAGSWPESGALLEEAGKVFVNYMSHIGFEERAAKSGPVQLKWISGQRKARQPDPPGS